MFMSEQDKKNSYGADAITVLEGLDPVRKRPGMYIGSTSSAGLHHLIWEVVDNSIDEAMAGYATEIKVVLGKDNMVSVADNGRGIPVDKMKATGISALETVLTKLHAGGKFGGGGYKVSGGLHGVGVSVVNALSTYLKAEVRRDGKTYMQEFKIGIPQAPVKEVGKNKENGTTITFQADPTIFTELEYNWGKILDRLRQQAYLTKGITINISDEREGHRAKKYKFHFEGGIKSYVKSLHRGKTKKHDTIFYIDKDVSDCKVEIALQYNDEYNETAIAFANNVLPVPGGPINKAPFGILPPSEVYFFGFFKKSTISITSTFASSNPATSVKVILTFAPLSNKVAFDFPILKIPPGPPPPGPPPPILRINKIHNPTITNMEMMVLTIGPPKKSESSFG